MSIDAPKRIHDFNSTIKLIVIIRDPVIRAVSQLTHKMDKKKIKFDPSQYENGSKLFEEKFLDEEGNIKTRIKDQLVSRGRYVESFKRWFKYFPKELIVVLNVVNFILNPYEEIKKMETFLGLKPLFQKEHFVYVKDKGFFCLRRDLNSKEIDCMDKNKGRLPFIPESLLNKLRDYYSSYNIELFELIDEQPFW